MHLNMYIMGEVNDGDGELGPFLNAVCDELKGV